MPRADRCRRVPIEQLLWSMLAVAAACAEGCGSEPPPPPPQQQQQQQQERSSSAAADIQAATWGTPWSCDLQQIDLDLDVAKSEGVATVTLAKQCAGQASFDVGEITVTGVGGAHVGDGLAKHRVIAGRLDVAVQGDRVVIAYAFARRPGLYGFSVAGSTVLWPEHCNMLYPCHPAMSDGVRFSVAVSGVKPGEVAIFPPPLKHDAPSFLPSVAVGTYNYHKLGTSTDGTEVGFWAEPSAMATVQAGLADLPKLFSQLEKLLGPYPYGDKVAGVSVDWGLQYGGLENHPYWHVSKLAMADPKVHIHEAVHGWIGAGVRLACWHDLVMSEGLADYFAAKAMEGVWGAAAAEKVWKAYAAYHAKKVGDGLDIVVWPDGCGDAKGAAALLNQLVYKKGALFWRDVAASVGESTLHIAIADFIAKRKHNTGLLKNLLASIEKQSGKDLQPLVKQWLKTKQ